MKALTAATLASLIVVWGCNGPSSTDSSESTSADAFSEYGLLNQCLSPTASVVGFSDTSIALSGNGSLGGSVVLLGKSQIQLTGNAQVSDRIVTPSVDQVTMTGNASAGQVEIKDLTGNESAVLDFGESLDSLAPTDSLDTIQASMTLQGHGGLNVIEVDGDVQLSGNNALTLNGGTHDLFLINVGGNVSVSGKANIVVSGGISPTNVLFRLTGNNARISITGNGTVEGTFFAPRGSAQVSGNGTIQGSIFAWNSISISGNGLTFSAVPFCPGNFVPPTPSPSPSPSTTATASPTPDPSTSSTANPSPSPSPMASSTATPSPSPTSSSTGTPAPSPSPSPSYSCTGPFCGGGVLGT